MTTMDLWRLERLRLTRTSRGVAVLGVFAFFGALGPLTARYLGEIVQRFGGGVEIVVPDPVPIDGIVQFISNAGQLGLLAVVVVAAGALAIDARPEWGAFLRTRVRRPADLVLPAAATATALAVLALVIGTVLAWGLTAMLLGRLDVPRLLLGTLLASGYLAFAVAVTAAVTSLTRSVLTAVLSAVGVLIALPVLALLPTVERWLPSELLGAQVAVLAGQPASELVPAVVTTVVVTPALLWLAIRRTASRET